MTDKIDKKRSKLVKMANREANKQAERNAKEAHKFAMQEAKDPKSWVSIKWREMFGDSRPRQ